ncbi:hypothetical protein ACWJJH_02775 [Endozoicomonadaceae bacterium StTr2]
MGRLGDIASQVGRLFHQPQAAKSQPPSEQTGTFKQFGVQKFDQPPRFSGGFPGTQQNSKDFRSLDSFRLAVIEPDPTLSLSGAGLRGDVLDDFVLFADQSRLRPETPAPAPEPPVFKTATTPSPEPITTSSPQLPEITPEPVAPVPSPRSETTTAQATPKTTTTAPAPEETLTPTGTNKPQSAPPRHAELTDQVTEGEGAGHLYHEEMLELVNDLFEGEDVTLQDLQDHLDSSYHSTSRLMDGARAMRAKNQEVYDSASGLFHKTALNLVARDLDNAIVQSLVDTSSTPEEFQNQLAALMDVPGTLEKSMDQHLKPGTNAAGAVQSWWGSSFKPDALSEDLLPLLKDRLEDVREEGAMMFDALKKKPVQMRPENPSTDL